MSEYRAPARMTGAPPRVFLITGAASGIGAALARRLAAPGVALALHTRANRAGLEATAAAARAAGAVTETLVSDLAHPAVPAALIAATLARFGRIDALIANAGFADATPLADLTDAALARSIETILAGFARLSRAALPHLPDGSGRIVAVSSFVAHVFRPGVPVFPASAAAKAGLEGLVRALAAELAPRGIAVNAVIPGFIRKDAGTRAAVDPARLGAQIAQIPLGRLGRPEEVAAAIAFLLAPEPTGLTGALLPVDGGLAL